MNSEETIREQFLDSVGAIYDLCVESVSSLAERSCESPIERLFLIAWYARRLQGLIESGGSDVYWSYPRDDRDVDQPFGDRVLPAFGPKVVNLIQPQFQCGRFRADFCVRRIARGPQNGAWFDVCSSPLVLVECDGHDFHERTPAQAQRDRSRDRILQRDGFSVLRFAGTEIVRDPAACVREVDEFLDVVMSDVEKAAPTAAAAVELANTEV